MHAILNGQTNHWNGAPSIPGGLGAEPPRRLRNTPRTASAVHTCIPNMGKFDVRIPRFSSFRAKIGAFVQPGFGARTKIGAVSNPGFSSRAALGFSDFPFPKPGPAGFSDFPVSKLRERCGKSPALPGQATEWLIAPPQGPIWQRRRCVSSIEASDAARLSPV
jgi:hypothetical protein